MATYARGWHPAAAAAPQQGLAPPFQGPPPIPAGVNIPVTQWKSGYWQFNPNYNPQAVRPSASNWMPSQAWGTYYSAQGTRNQQQSFNPYKRQPKPPSAEYLATKLSDNPLGLTNMIPVEELERQQRERQDELRRQEEEHQEVEAKSTPWVWQPRPLDDEEDESQNQTSRPHEHGSSSVHKQTRPGSAQPNGLARQNTEPVIQPNITKDSRPSRTATDPTPVSYLYAPPAKTARTPERPATVAAQEPQPYTSKGLLQPTFSRAIVCTPERYNTPTPNSSQRANTYTSPSRPPTRGSEVEALTSHLSHLSASSNSLTRHHSMPNQSNNGHHSTSKPSHPVIDAELCEEPAEFLSPLMIPITPKPATRTNLSRNPSGSAASLDTIPEALSTTINSIANPRHTPQEPSPTNVSSHTHPQSRSASRPSSRHGSRSSSTHTSPYNSVPHSSEPSPISPSHTQGHSPSTAHFPSSSINTTRSSVSSSRKSSISGSLSNPLPQPPTEIPFPSLSKISTPSSASTSAKYSITVQYPQRTSPPSYIYAAPQSQSQANQTLPALYTSPTKTHHRSSHSQSHSQSQPHKHSYKHNDSHNQPQQSSKPTPRRRRKGYWNRRGDHITDTGYVVYAPPDHVYPPDLDNYPDGKEGGYMDHNGNRTRWVERPALPNLESYEKLIEYVYL